MRLALVSVVLLLSIASSADAARISWMSESCTRGECYPGGAQLMAAPGERNDVVVRQEGDHVVIEDRGAPTEIATPCTRDLNGAARCPRRFGVRIHTEDGDDRVSVPDGRVTALLGPGNDVFEGTGSVDGGDGDDRLVGGSGDDQLQGGGGRDALVGGDGPDWLDGDEDEDTLDAGAGADQVELGEQGAASTDLAEGGPGRDLASWERSNAPRGVLVDLADDRPDGVPGAMDIIDGIEDVAGTFAADSLAGDDGANSLDGGSGADRIEGRGGADVLFIGPRAPRGGNTGQARPSCGSGDDRLSSADARLSLPRDCEGLLLADGVLDVIVADRSERRLVLVVTAETRRRVSFVARADPRSRWRSSASFTLRPGVRRRVVLPLRGPRSALRVDLQGRDRRVIDGFRLPRAL
jgi:Ca2+-binding RTX toxin-like protein